ncbi:putative ribonuclease H-like domain-containing protein, partial [Tanacetum coccineum]
MVARMVGMTVEGDDDVWVPNPQKEGSSAMLTVVCSKAHDRMCDKKNSVLFTDTVCFVLSFDFKLTDESQILLKVPRKNNMYSVDMKNIVPKESLTCLVAKATLDESMLWHRRLGTNSNDSVESCIDETTTFSAAGKRMIMVYFKLQEVWTLMDLPHRQTEPFGTKWVYMNKTDERGNVIRKQAGGCNMVTTQDEELRLMMSVLLQLLGLKQLGLYLALPHSNDLVVYQDGCEQVCISVWQDFKEAWYETLSTYLLDNGFQRGQIDKTLFIKRVKSDIRLVQVYVDDIIFGSTKKKLCTEFEKLMHKKFQMSSIARSLGELTFFLGLQVTQKNDGIFISQEKYVGEILKKFGFSTMKTANTPIETSKPLMKDENDEDVDVHLYGLMIGSLMYLTSLRPDIIYLKGQPILGVWYPKDSPFDLEAHTDSDYAGASLDKKFTAGDQNVADLLTKAFDYAQMMLETAVDDEFQVSSVGLTYY